MGPPYYRCCWHEVSRPFLMLVYNPKAFFPHTASLRQTFVHCAIFLLAAIRRCMARASVPSWGAALSRPLPVIALVSHYLTNKLIGCRPVPYRRSFTLARLSTISPSFDRLWSNKGLVPTCYSLVCQGVNTLDLHRLGTPSALILS